MAEQTKVMSGTKQDSNGFPENYVNRLFIDTNPVVNEVGDVDLTDVSTGKWAWVASGITTQTPSANETTTNEAYYDGGGFTDTDVTGKQVSLAISGSRKLGNPAQDFIADKFWKMGNSVKTRVIWITNGIPVIAQATLTNIVPSGGGANAKQTFSCTISFNGQPRIPNGQLKLTLTSTPTVYSASVDTSKQTTDDTKQIEAIVIDSVDDSASQSGSTPNSTNTPAAENK